METCTSSGPGTEYVGSADPSQWVGSYSHRGYRGGDSGLRGQASRLGRIRGRAEWQGQPGHKSQVAGHRQAGNYWEKRGHGHERRGSYRGSQTDTQVAGHGGGHVVTRAGRAKRTKYKLIPRWSGSR
ncbi:hypothetical protein BKA56DRAFT_582250 [Ilyonectria sp. MPI-CAGE-AT-0026]|nr:hypothetical protein BKA56DRAFT_582250 [Ilyonectria sp. MPI-CAGE-AT-0026]